MTKPQWEGQWYVLRLPPTLPPTQVLLFRAGMCQLTLWQGARKTADVARSVKGTRVPQPSLQKIGYARSMRVSPHLSRMRNTVLSIQSDMLAHKTHLSRKKPEPVASDTAPTPRRAEEQCLNEARSAGAAAKQWRRVPQSTRLHPTMIRAQRAGAISTDSRSCCCAAQSAAISDVVAPPMLSLEVP